MRFSPASLEETEVLNGRASAFTFFVEGLKLDSLIQVNGSVAQIRFPANFLRFNREVEPNF